MKVTNRPHSRGNYITVEWGEKSVSVNHFGPYWLCWLRTMRCLVQYRLFGVFTP